MFNNLIAPREKSLFFYSPYNFIREVESSKQLKIVSKRLVPYFEKKDSYFQFESNAVVFLLKHLSWDTHFFHKNIFKLEFVLFEESDFKTLSKAVSAFRKFLFAELKADNCFIEIPSEDIQVIQALSANGFHLTETRLTFFKNDLHTFENERFLVRKAFDEDIIPLRNTASKMRNNFDRFHADPLFTQEIADDFLAKYTEESIKGTMADLVLVPDEPGIPVDAFMTLSYNNADSEILGLKIPKMVLTAVSSETCKGWYFKLMSEMLYHVKEIGADYFFTTTQSTNRAVFKGWNKVNGMVGGTTHILSCSSPD
ncbi:dTDP-4-amino-4,6-dideoxy-D-galactose acyltransferase [Pseudarcicella hirudinis]|uniref:dTDP-4-amino-4,6-dideoxy-D-galactose acyltransferase n=2 Tax=Pseudarcicella hirudinis TaxID=1079859 RepID=A0A1I5XBS9_9BACT|nr:hypothetical protein [Pseudarcicella hirudinis]SFQ29428.1 dTDP-4-amino-4,6-dideoxy-D-galactose acyltransferase [Pseudarcicella hirudinis]